MADREEFLVCYDYGGGGLWALVRARSRAHFESKYPKSHYPHLHFYDEPQGIVDMNSARKMCFQDIELPHTACWENMLEGARKR